MAAVIVAIILSSGAMYVWQHGQETDQAGRAALLQAQVARAQADVARLRTQAGSYAEEIGALEQHIYGLRAVSKDLRAQLRGASRQQRGLARELVSVRTQLGEANQRLNTLVGPPLADGSYVGYLLAVGASQEPARVVFDLSRFTTDQEISGIVNTSPRWRILEVAAQAPVTLHTWRPRTVTVGVRKLGFIFSSGLKWNEPMTGVPYLITVRDNVITAIEEQTPGA
jgi:hypothetical protein